MSSTRSKVAATVTAVAVVAASWWMYQSVSEYGLEGTLRLVWEGDPYSGSKPSDVRKRKRRALLQKLQALSDSLQSQEELLAALEVGLERARVAVDNSQSFSTSPSLLVKEWEAVVIMELPSSSTKLDLQKQLAKISYDLDQTAFQVDQVMIPVDDGADEEFWAGVKGNKKALSTRIVELMERTDELIAVYTKALEGSKPT